MLRRRERPRLRLSRGSRVRHLPGSGIGLALVRRVARRLGGEVNLRARRVATPNSSATEVGMQLVIGAGRTAAIQSRFRSVTTATTPSRRRPWASRARQPDWPGR
jgi:signal transduction histidine kinase